MSGKVAQRDAALKMANHIRLKRAAVKRGLADGTLGLTSALEIPETQGMQVAELMAALPRFGSRRTHKLLARAGVGDHLSVGELTPRRKVALTTLYADGQQRLAS